MVNYIAVVALHTFQVLYPLCLLASAHYESHFEFIGRQNGRRETLEETDGVDMLYERIDMLH